MRCVVPHSRKKGRRSSRELGGMGTSTRGMPRHSMLEEKVGSAKLFCLDTGSHGLGQLKWVLKE